MKNRFFGAWLTLFAIAPIYAEPPHAEYVCGFTGVATGGFREAWDSHRGEVVFSGVRKAENLNEIRWLTAPVPPSSAAVVTFVWSGGLGIGPCYQSDFTLSVNGRPAVDFDIAVQPTEFAGLEEGCRLLFNVLYAPPVKDFTVFPKYATGYFYLSVPRSWVTSGKPAAIQVRAKPIGSEAWFALTTSEDAALEPPNQICQTYHKIEKIERFLPPPKDQEASLEWYRKQYDDNSILAAIGPPGDPADLGVSTTGQLMYNFDRVIPGTPYISNALVFAVVEDDRAVPFGWEPATEQDLVDDALPCVITKWQSNGWEIEQTAFGRPLRGESYTTGLESTLGWAEFLVTNRTAGSRELIFLATRAGNRDSIQRNLRFQEGAVFENDSARFAAHTTDDFTVEFLPIFPPHEEADTEHPEKLLRRGGLYDALAVRSTFHPGETKGFSFCCVFDSPGMDHWKAAPPRVAPEELLSRTATGDRENAIREWGKLADGLRHFLTPDNTLNCLLIKGVLDGYNLTKRWNGNWICIDSVCYRRQWDDTSAKWIYALDLMGDHVTSERLLDTIFARQGFRKPAGTRTHEGCFSDITNLGKDGSNSSWASCNGWALWCMAQHARLANAKNCWKQHQEQILAGAEWISRERSFSKELPDNPCAGLIKGKFVCDMPDEWGPGGVGYFTYTDAISYMGLRDTALLMREWGLPEGERLLEEAEAYRQDIVAAVDRLTDKSSDPWFVPWALHAPNLDHAYLSGVCGPINLAYAGVVPRSDSLIDHVIRWNIERTHKGSPESSATKSMFYSQELAITLLELGRVEQFLRMFYTVLAANTSRTTLTTSEWWNNTQPHLHSIASMIRMARTMLVQERDGGLYLLQGTPRRWYEQGQEIRITEAPTLLGHLSVRTVSNIDSGDIRLYLSLPERIGTTPTHIRLRLPGSKRIANATIEGDDIAEFDDQWIILRGMVGEVEIVVKTH